MTVSDWVLVLGCFCLSVIAGAGLFQALFVMPEYFADPPASLRRYQADRPVLVFGHHHPWAPGSDERPDDYFGIHPDDSERLVGLVARRAREVSGASLALLMLFDVDAGTLCVEVSEPGSELSGVTIPCATRPSPWSTSATSRSRSIAWHRARRTRRSRKVGWSSWKPR